MALVSEAERYAEHGLSWIIVVGASGYMSSVSPPLLRRTQKGKPLSFEPFRWQLISAEFLVAVATALILWQLFVDPRDLLRMPFVPRIVAGSIGSMCRPTGTRAEWLGTGRSPPK